MADRLWCNCRFPPRPAVAHRSAAPGASLIFGIWGMSVETLSLQDIAHGRGLMLIGPHGDLAERVARVKFDRRGRQTCALMQPKQGLSALQYSQLTVSTAC